VKPAVIAALAVFALLLGFVSARLLSLAAHTRRAPELFLGLSTALPLVGYGIGFAGAAIGGGVPARWTTEIGGSLCDLGFVATLAFVWVVFRREERWARIVGLVLALGLFAMPFVNHFVVWSDGIPSAMVPRSILRTFCYGWAAFESLYYARLMQRRIRFGLAEPIVADRFYLWGFAHICFSLMLLLVMGGVKLHLSGAKFADFCTLAGFAFALFAAVLLTLSFFPPNRYVRYVEKRHSRQVTL
jgi:hypothetical protein